MGFVVVVCKPKKKNWIFSITSNKYYFIYPYFCGVNIWMCVQHRWNETIYKNLAQRTMMKLTSFYVNIKIRDLTINSHDHNTIYYFYFLHFYCCCCCCSFSRSFIKNNGNGKIEIYQSHWWGFGYEVATWQTFEFVRHL